MTPVGSFAMKYHISNFDLFVYSSHEFFINSKYYFCELLQVVEFVCFAIIAFINDRKRKIKKNTKNIGVHNFASRMELICCVTPEERWFSMNSLYLQRE